LQSNQMVVEQLLNTAAYPLLTGAAVSLALGKLTRIPRDAAVAVALLAGFAVGFFAVSGFGEFPPIKVHEWLPYTGLPPLILFLVCSKQGQKVQAIAALVVVALVFWLDFAPITHAFSVPALIAWLIGSAIAWLGLWHVWDRSRDEQPRREFFLLFVVIATGVSLVSVLDGGAVIGQAAGSLAAASGGIFLASLLQPKLEAGSATIAVFLCLFAGLLVNAYHYVEVRPLPVALAYCAGFCVLLLKHGGLREASFIKRTSLTCLAGLLPIIIAVIFLLMNAPVDDYYDY